MMTVTLVFDQKCERVLMCYHQKQGLWNFIGGHVEEMEQPKCASYRELEEETGISRENIDLKFVREEHVTANNVNNGGSSVWSLHVTAGILKNDVEFKEEKNPLMWISIYDLTTILLESTGNGNCWVFLRDACDVLGIQYDERKIVRG